MTPTDKLRALLDERGVEYGSGFGGDTLWTGRDGIEWRWDKQKNILAMYSHTITPEQAIAATVGADYGITFAPTLDRPPETMVGETVYDGEGNAIGWITNATASVGTCHMEVHDNLAETEGMGEVWLECDECHWQMPLEPTTPKFKHCPNCGKEIVK